MSQIIRNAFKALEDVIDEITIRPVKKSILLKEETNERGQIKPLEEQTIKDLFIEAGAYVLTKEFKKNGMTYFLFVEGTSNGEAADLLFDEFDVENIDGFLLEILDEERNFVDDITVKELKSIFEKEEEPKTETLKEAEGEEESSEIPYLEAPVVKVIEVAKEHIDSTPEEVQTAEPAQEELKEEKPEPKEETLQLTGFNEAVGNAQFFPGEDGDIVAAEFVEKNNLKDFRVEWDSEKDGYLVSWGKEVAEGKKITESQHLSLKDKDDLEKAKEIVNDNEEEEAVEQIVDVNAETVDDLKKSYIGSTILQCPVCRTMIYKDPQALVKPEGETAEGEKLYNVDEACPHCGAKEGFDLIGQVASLDVNTEQQPEPPMTEPAEQSTPEETPVEQPEQGEDNLDVVEEEPAEEDKKKKTKVPLIPESMEKETKELVEEEKTWGVRQDVEYKTFKSHPELVLGFIVKGLTKKDAEDKVKQMNTEKLNKAGIFYTASQEEGKGMKEKYEDVILESFDEVKFDKLTKKYLNEVYENIDSYITRRVELIESSSKVLVEGIITFKSGKTKNTKFVFEAKEITKKGKIKFVGINETFTKKKAFTLVGSINGSNMLSESLTYSYSVDSKKVYGQVKNPTKI